MSVSSLCTSKVNPHLDSSHDIYRPLLLLLEGDRGREYSEARLALAGTVTNKLVS